MLTKQSEQPSIYATFYSAILFDVKTYTILNSCTASALRCYRKGFLVQVMHNVSQC